jgi:hypothetical protein
MRKLFLLVVLGVTAAVAAASAAAGGFDQYGYNDQARIFNGTGSSWCLAGGQAADCQGVYSGDKLVMKWNALWDQGNAEGWTGDYTGAWTTNEWNGAFPGGSGEVWHYKIVWVGDCADGATFADGGYCVWGQFEVISDHGTADGAHVVYAHATPNGLGGGGR